MADRGTRHQVGEFRGARGARPSLKDAVKKCRRRVHGTERAPEDHAAALGGRAGIPQRVFDRQSSEFGRAIEPTSTSRVEMGVRVHRGIVDGACRKQIGAPFGPHRTRRAHDRDARDDRNAARRRRPSAHAGHGRDRGFARGEHQDGGQPAKAECVRQRRADAGHFAADVRYVKQVDRGVRLIEPSGRHESLPRHDECRDDRFDAPRRTQRMADLAFAARDRYAGQIAA